MIQHSILTILICTMFGWGSPKPSASNLLPKVTREEWWARAPTEIQKLYTPVPNVVIHHSHTPEACFNKTDCCEAMRTMQYMHVDLNGWADIGYNFAVGSDGLVYEGRGWNRVGAHSRGFNSQSLGIVLIGDWVSKVPPEIQLQTAKELISEGVQLGWISPKYNLVGHRQVRDTECPGDALFEVISGWKHFNSSIHIRL